MLTFVSLQADNASFMYRDVVAYLQRRTGIATEFIDGVPWQTREHMLARGDAQIGFICGLPYVRKTATVELLAAPVVRGERYGDQPIYFSDVIVRADGPFHMFADLRGAAWAYNEPGSQSGYNVTAAHLAGIGETAAFFGRIVGSGAHQRSLAMLLAGEIDATAIDSTVLELELRRAPALREQLRVVEIFGPSPHPPVVARRDLPAHIKQIVREALLAMHRDSEGRAILAQGIFARFADVRDADYDPIRRMAAQADAAPLLPRTGVKV